MKTNYIKELLFVSGLLFALGYFIVSDSNLIFSYAKAAVATDMISYELTSDKNLVVFNEEINYTLTIKNKTNLVLKDLKLSSPIPKYTTYTNQASNCGSSDNSYISWKLNELKPLGQSGDTFQVTYKIRFSMQVDNNPINIFISPTGDDNSNGYSVDVNAACGWGPVKTLDRARDLIRERKNEGRFTKAINVNLRGGNYELNNPFTLNQTDSGTLAYPITYKNYNNEKTVISGGQKIAGVWNKLNTNPSNLIYWVNVPSQTNFNSLFVNSKRSLRARTPNPLGGTNDFYEMAQYPAGYSGDKCKEFYFENSDLSSINSLSNPALRQNIEVVTYRKYQQTRSRIGSSGLVNFSENKITFTNPLNKVASPPRCFDWESRSRYYLENFLEALDTPGEWYLDKSTNRLYYWATDTQEANNLLQGTANIITPKQEQLLNLTGTDDFSEPISNINFQGLNFAYTDWKLPTSTDTGTNPYTYEGVYAGSQSAYDIHARDYFAPAINISAAKNIKFYNNRFNGTGGYAIYAKLIKDSTFEHNIFEDIGAGAIDLGEKSFFVINTSIPSLKSSGNKIINNKVRNFGTVFNEGVGIFVRLADSTVISKNEVSDGDYSGISVGWSFYDIPSGYGNNQISFNKIHDVNRALYDGAGIYVLGDQPNTLISHNQIMHLNANPRISTFFPDSQFSLPFPKDYGIYLEQGSDGVDVKYNLVFDVATPIYRNYDNATDTNASVSNNILNNIFVADTFNSYVAALYKNSNFQKNVLYIRSSTEPQVFAHYFKTSCDMVQTMTINYNLYYFPDKNNPGQTKPLNFFRSGSSPVCLFGINPLLELRNEKFYKKDMNSLINTDDPQFVGPLDNNGLNYLLKDTSPAVVKLGFDNVLFKSGILKAGPDW